MMTLKDKLDLILGQLLQIQEDYPSYRPSLERMINPILFILGTLQDNSIKENLVIDPQKNLAGQLLHFRQQLRHALIMLDGLRNTLDSIVDTDGLLMENVRLHRQNEEVRIALEATDKESRLSRLEAKGNAIEQSPIVVATALQDPEEEETPICSCVQCEAYRNS